MAGLSMGGGHTLNIGHPHLDKFAYLGFSSSGVFSAYGAVVFGGNGPTGPSLRNRNKAVLDNQQLKKGLKLVGLPTGKTISW